MIQIDRHSPEQSSQDTLQQLQQKLQQAKEVIYDELARKSNEEPITAFEKAASLLAKYQKISNTLHHIQNTAQRLESISQQKLINEAMIDTQQFKNDTEDLIGKLKTRQKLYQEEKLLIIELIQMISIQTASVKEMEVEIKQHRLLNKSIGNLKQIYNELKQQQENSIMYRKIRLTEEKDNNEYILNQIHKDSKQQLTHLKDKLEALEQKLRLTRAKNQALNKQYYDFLNEFNKQKIQTTLLSQPAKPKPRKKKVESKGQKSEQEVVSKISEVEAIETEVLVMSGDSKWELYASVVLSFISLCVIMQFVTKFI